MAWTGILDSQRRREQRLVHGAYERLVAQAREPAFYAEYGVPDSLDGRFEMVALHVFLLLNRLKREPATDFAQVLFDLFCADMDRSLREMGVSDLGVGRRVRAMAEALYGRIAAYEAGLAAADEGILEEALRRNLYGTLSAPERAHCQALAGYLRVQQQALTSQPLADLLRGEVAFRPVGAALMGAPS